MTSSSSDVPPFVHRKLATLAPLEEEKIRLWTPAERLKLRDQAVLNSKNQGQPPPAAVSKWFRVCRDYLLELGLDQSRIENLNDKDRVNKLWVLDRLSSMAIHDEYQDQVQEGRIEGCNSYSSQTNDQNSNNGSSNEDDVNMSRSHNNNSQQDNNLSLTSPLLSQLIPELNRLLEASELPVLLGEDISEDDVAAAVNLIQTRICGSNNVATTGPGTGQKELVDLNTVPIGIDLDDGGGGEESETGESGPGSNRSPNSNKAVLQKPIAMLRFLHNSHMRDFQVSINETINKLQQFTANPKTDTALGRVGR